MNDIIKVGIGTILLDGDKILCGLRKSSLGLMHWAFPGGHLEHGETPEACAIRETHEETGLIIQNVLRGPWTNDFHPEHQHYITLFMVSRYTGGTVELKEPDKCQEWKWVDFQSMPNPLFLSIKNMLKAGYDLQYYQNLLSQSQASVVA